VILSALITLGVCFMFPLLSLCLVQAFNACKGLTTNERFSKFKQKGLQNDLVKPLLEDQKLTIQDLYEPIQPENRACLTNCQSLLCHPEIRD